MGVEYVAIDEKTIEAAVAILARGFPGRPAAHWRGGLERMRTAGENARLGIPLGRLLRVDGVDVGVLLTPAGEQVQADGTARKVVNLSSWYLDPEHRWRAPIMLKGAMADRSATYTDLTPTKPVQAIIQALGFRRLNQGVVIVPTPIAAAMPGSASLRDLADVPTDGIAPRLRDSLLAHCRLGCRAFAFEGQGTWIPILVKPIRLKGIPGAHLIYCGEEAGLSAAMPALARRLLASGRLVLLLDLTERTASLRGSIPFRDRSFRFAKGDVADGEVDLTWSEFAYFDVYS